MNLPSIAALAYNHAAGKQCGVGAAPDAGLESKISDRDPERAHVLETELAHKRSSSARTDITAIGQTLACRTVRCSALVKGI